MLVILFVVTASTLLAFLLLLICRLRAERAEAMVEKNKVQEIYEGLYQEYERVRGHQWAKKHISELIKNLVTDVEQPSTRTVRRA